MDKGVFIGCMRYLEAAYRHADFGITGDPEQIKVWYDMLGDIPETVLMQAIRKWVAVNKWPPHFSDLRKISADIIQPPPVSWAEAWEQVGKAIRNHGMYDEQGAMDSLDKTTKAAVKAMGFKTLCMSQNVMADRAHFQKIYERLEKEEKEARALPQTLIDGIARTQKELGYERTSLPGTTE